jgi:hypothetical protein
MPNRQKVVKYKRPKNINIGIIIFGITFIYIIINLVLFFSRDKVQMYEVVQGNNASNANSYYTGLIIRNEKVATAPKAGYINFFVRDGAHISAGSNLYTIDETGTLASTMENAASSENQLSSDVVNTIKDELGQFTTQFNTNDFSSVYDLKYNIDGTLLENYNAAATGDTNETTYEIVKSDTAGIIMTYVDGYESLTEDAITKKDFDASEYKKSSIKTNDLIKTGDPIYKTIDSETWSIIIPLTDDEVKEYKDKTSVKIMFSNDKITTNADFTIIENSDGKYGKITLSKYNVRYLNDRFIDIKIIGEDVTGLKIPKTSVTQKDFYIIPVSYHSKGGDNDDDGFNKEVYTTDGEVSVKFEAPDIYCKTDDYYYVDKSAFKAGDVLIMNESGEKYQIGETKTLKGVYNINNGYTNFKQIDILADASDYYIVASDTSYGIKMYDHIVLDASKVKENKVVYQ